MRSRFLVAAFEMEPLGYVSGAAPRTIEEIEAFLDRQDRRDPAAVLQDGFAKRMEELKK